MSKRSKKVANQNPPQLTDEDRKIYYEYRFYGIKEFDKLIVYISGGALALTTTYFYQVRGEAFDASWIIVSWIAFSITLILNLISHLISISSTDAMLDEDSCKAENINGFTDVFNKAAVLLIAIGILAFFLFAYKTI